MKKDWVSFRVLFAGKDTQSLMAPESFKLKLRHIGQNWRRKRLRAIGHRKACRQERRDTRRDTKASGVPR
jgi:hypothetical protein